MRRTLLGTILLAAALALTGCSAGTATDPEPMNPGVVAPDEGQEGAGGADGGVVDEQDRDVVVTGEVAITTEDPISAADDAIRIVESAGGRIDARTEYAPANGDNGSAALTLRIPAAKLTAVLDDLKELGDPEQVRITSNDVTVESADLDARISSLRASIERLTGFLTSADDIDQLIALEGQLTTRQGELESLEAQQRLLVDQVAMSTISLYLSSDTLVPATVPSDFWSGLQAGWGAFVAFWTGLVIAFGVLLPWLVAAGIVTLVVLLVVRRIRSRRPSTPSATPTTATPPPAAPPIS
jgi:hypothetical protein